MAEDDFLDDAVQHRASREPAVAGEWAATKVVMRLRRAREQKGLTQAQVAERLGVAPWRVADLERRPWNASFARIHDYARAIGESADELRDAF